MKIYFRIEIKHFNSGVSPFYAGSRLRTMFRFLLLLFNCSFIFDTMPRSLNANYDMSIDQMKKTSQTAKNLIGSLLKKLPSTRLTVSECLNHQWLVTRYG